MWALVAISVIILVGFAMFILHHDDRESQTGYRTRQALVGLSLLTLRGGHYWVRCLGNAERQPRRRRAAILPFC
jgi:hypothetical protein